MRSILACARRGLGRRAPQTDGCQGIRGGAEVCTLSPADRMRRSVERRTERSSSTTNTIASGSIIFTLKSYNGLFEASATGSKGSKVFRKAMTKASKHGRRVRSGFSDQNAPAFNPPHHAAATLSALTRNRKTPSARKQIYKLRAG